MRGIQLPVTPRIHEVLKAYSDSAWAFTSESLASTADFDKTDCKDTDEYIWICFIQTMATYSGSIIGTSNKMNSVCSCNVMEVPSKRQQARYRKAC